MTFLGQHRLKYSARIFKPQISSLSFLNDLLHIEVCKQVKHVPTLHVKCEAYGVHNMVACVSLRADNVSGKLSSCEDEKCLPGVTCWRKTDVISNDFHGLN